MIPASMASRTSMSRKCSSPMIRIVVVPAARSAEDSPSPRAPGGRGRGRAGRAGRRAGHDRGVTVAVDQPGHHEPVAEVEHLGAGRRRGADGGDATVLHGDHGIADRGGAGTVEERATADRADRHVSPVDADAVVAPRRLGGDVALADVPAHRLRIAPGRRAPAAPAAGHDAYDLALGDRMLGGLADVAHRAVGRGDLDAVHGAGAAAAEPPRRRGLALEAERDERVGQEPVDALDAEAAAVACRRRRSPGAGRSGGSAWWGRATPRPPPDCCAP